MIKAEKNVLTVGIEVRDAGERNEVSVVVVGDQDEVMTATAHLMANIVNVLYDAVGIDKSAYLGMLCSMAAKMMDKEGRRGR